MKTVKLASRYLIPVELLLSILMMSWGIAGAWLEGNLNESLRAEGTSMAWGVGLLAVGVFQFIPAAIEWLNGRDWKRRRLLLVLCVRSAASFVAASTWVFAVYTMFTVPIKPLIYIALTIQAIAGFLFCAWTFIGNERARVVIDPNIKTSDFERTIILDRARLGDF